MGKHRENIIMLNGARQGGKWRRECGRAVFAGPSQLCSSACKQPFKSARPPLKSLLGWCVCGGGALPEEILETPKHPDDVATFKTD